MPNSNVGFNWGDTVITGKRVKVNVKDGVKMAGESTVHKDGQGNTENVSWPPVLVRT